MNEDKVEASIITIGDELMIGQVIDTNSAWIAQQLNIAGIWVRKRVSVGDNYDEMWTAMEQESIASKLVLITGGLGPTADDITKPFLCDYFGTTLVMDEDVLRHVQHLFESVLKRPFIERNKKQAEVPAGCTVIHNSRGTAPGMLFEKDGVIYVSMPGVPHEMKGMMEDIVLPLLKKKLVTGYIIHRTMLLAGIGESFLAEHIQQWEEALPKDFKLAYLPNHGLIRLRITGNGSNDVQLSADLNEQFEALKILVSEWLVIDEDLSMPQVIGKMLNARKKLLGTAESCTGGYIAHLFTREAGASDKFNGTVVSYSNEVKKNLLGVRQETLDTTGAVSEETVTQMARGALKALKADYVVATSGIMGPDGGSYAKPVGTVWVAVGDNDNLIAQEFHFRYDRLRNIEMTANSALNLLRKFMIAHHS
jgi:nicotinamide-nucleotide amidase